ncbi:MAG: efflux RND transporter permease subunit [Candidatus Eisenbacteria bacterium]|uniref:Efflux RND transporter permease subunit n=1 Tax=Eiseniibacteriota bacterium TaxID=2212470 RepID=A0A956NHB2_UNCEI|nr:efflux RND transporter permease subunit [Candidatus Eisenbacteria bacterium]MCB9465671.1 efflux RND transporter permease subunit [Candidatus Eisenbacteria bacterium]
MNRLVEWFAQNPVAANILMFVIMGGGLFAIMNVRQEVFPEFSLDMIQVSVVYPGAAPAEVEEAVCVRIEEEVDGIDGVKQISSVASENIGIVTIEVETSADVTEVLDDVKSRIDAIDTFPEEVEEPVVEEMSNRRQVISVSIAGDIDEGSLKELGERVRDEITSIDGISVAELVNVRPYEISIEVSEDAMRRYGIMFQDVVTAVRRSSLDLPGGSIKTDGGEILLRAEGQAYEGHQFEQLVLRSREDGSRVIVGDVATVVDGFADTDESASFDGKRSVLVNVFRVGEQNAIGVANSVNDYVEQAQARMPEGVTLTTWSDNSKVLRSRMSVLMRNGIGGFFLVLASLALFLRFKLAFWVSLGIPVSFLGAAFMMPGLDVSINLISLFAFIVVLGIVVDDAIVVGENVYTHQRRHGHGMRGAIEGTQEVAVPVLFAVLTTIAAFGPLLNVPGATGKIMRVIPMIVIPTLVFSLIESLFILPSHLSHMRYDNAKLTGPGAAWRRFQDRFATGLERFVDRVYRPSLELGLKHRYITFAVGLGTLIFTLGMVGGGWIKFSFFPPVEADYVTASLTMPLGTPSHITAEGIRQLEATALELRGKLEEDNPGERPFQHVSAIVGSTPFGSARQGPGHSDAGGVSSGHIGEVTIELASAENRTVRSQQVLNRWREMTGSIPDAVELRFNSSLFSAGDALNIQLSGLDLDQLRAAADAVKAKLAEYPGVSDISDSFREGKKEIELDIRPEAEALGITLQDLALQVRQGFYGAEVQSIQRGRDEVKVYVRYPRSERASLGDLENMRIRTPAGLEVPFHTVANASLTRGFASIKRVDRMRTVNVTADVDDDQATAGEILGDLRSGFLPKVSADHGGIKFSFEGEQKEQRETFGGLLRGFLLALLLIYALMAIPFKSYIQPIIVMSAIPFGIVGAIWGHAIMRMNLTMLSMFGIVALTGVVVNDSLVLVDRVNNLRRQGMPLYKAVREAGVSRFRPILLTSLTTFLGLTPLLLERSMQAKFLVPMAVSLAFGVVFATFITLMIVPAGYVILEDLQKLGSKIWHWVRGKEHGGETNVHPSEPAWAPDRG